MISPAFARFGTTTFDCGVKHTVYDKLPKFNVQRVCDRLRQQGFNTSIYCNSRGFYVYVVARDGEGKGKGSGHGKDLMLALERAACQAGVPLLVEERL